MPILYIVLGALAAVLGMLVYTQNPQLVELSFLDFRVHASLSLVLVAGLAIGVLVGYLLAVPARVQAAWLVRRRASEIRARDKTIATQAQRIADMERERALATAVAPTAPPTEVEARRVA